MSAKKQYNFGEKQEEFSSKDGKRIPVVLTAKYLETKQRVIDMLEEGKYKGLNESYFWILMNRTKKGEMAYTGLIISHDGMKIINDSLPIEKKVKAGCFSLPVRAEYGDGLYMFYQDEETYEFGEVSTKNCLNAYPYAMLQKRTFDRAVKDKAKLYGVYSEEEAEEFKNKEYVEDKEMNKKTEAPKADTKEVDHNDIEPQFITKDQYEELKKIYSKEEIMGFLKTFSVSKPSELTYKQANLLLERGA